MSTSAIVTNVPVVSCGTSDIEPTSVRSPTVAPHLKTVLGALLGQLQDAVQFCPPACASKLTLVTHVVNSLNNA